MSSEKISFGVGCFHFTPIQETPFELTGKDYIENLESALGQISNISEINVDGDENFKDKRISVEDGIPPIDESFSYFPSSLNLLFISFKIYLPSRLLSDLHPYRLETGTENFEIIIRHDPYYFPLTYINPLGMDNKADPSDAVIATREFLKQKFNESEDIDFRFELLGPSPFHADFYLSENKNQIGEPFTKGINYSISKRKGYDDIDFFYDPNKFESLEEAKFTLFDELTDELALFYFIIHSNLMLMHKWDSLQGETRQLLELHQKNGFKAFLDKIISIFKPINETFIKLADFRHDLSYSKYQIQKAVKEVSEFRPPILKNYIQKEINDQLPYPTDEYESLITLLENQRRFRIEGVVTLVAALLGGFVGSLITILFTSS